MKQYFTWRVLLFCTLCFHLVQISRAQSPGLLVQPKNSNGVTFLNPNGDKYTSKTTAGFVNSDVTESEIAYKRMPFVVQEPVGDNNGGQNDGATDFVPGADSSGFYAFYDGTNILFRFRVGGKSNGARGYSVLIDTDLKIGSTGFYSDPNYIAPTSQRSGNPGFELEVVYAQGKGVQILNVDGTVAGTITNTFAENSHAQISVALSKNGGDADYFVDFGVPVSALGIGTQYIRLVGTTCNSAASALGNNASDVFGINDIPFKNLIPNWTTLINMQCGIGVSAISANGAGICICTPAPVVSGPISPGTNVSVTGVWNRLSTLYASQSLLTLYKNSTAVGTLTVTTGVPWSITVPSITVGDTLYATAQSAPEQQCQQSNRVVATCSGVVPKPTIGCASLKGMQGVIPLGATVEIYEVTPANTNPYTTQYTAGLVYTNNASNRTFSFYGNNPQTGDPCSYSQQQFTYNNIMLVVNQGGCLSQPYFMCLSSQTWNTPTLQSNLKLNTPIIAGQTSVSGTGGGNTQLYRLFVNGRFASAATGQLGGSFTFNNLNLIAGDTLVVYEQTNNSSCMSYSPTFTVLCALPAVPTITSNNGEILSTETSIGGYSSLPGAVVSLYKGTSPTGSVVGTATVNNAGEWLVNGLILTSGENYYAVQVSNGCASAATSSVNIVAPTPLCPSITGSYTESATKIDGTFASAFTGTVRLYRDGALIGSKAVNNATTWSIPVNQDLTNFTDVLTPGDSLSATSWTSAYGERSACGFTIVACDVPPVPVATPGSMTIPQGGSATFTIASSSNRALYSLVDNSNNAYGTSVFGNGNAISLSSTAFNTPGTYNLKIAADNMAAPACRQTQNVVVTVNATTLPLRFLSVNVKAMTDQTKQLTWSVVAEESVSHYQVERSADCTHFEPVATIGLQGGSADAKLYSYTDVASLSSSAGLCYRVKAITSSGAAFYSKVVNAAESKSMSALLVPNPSKGETTLYVTSEKAQLITIDIADAMGRQILTQKVQVNEGRNAVTLPDLSNLAKGHYIVNVKTSASTRHLKLVLE